MKGLNLLGLAWRQLRREMRAGELPILAIALVVAVMATSSIGHFTERLNKAMLMRATEFLGADLVISANTKASDQQRSLSESYGLLNAEVVEFSSMLGSADALQLASVKAVSSQYPLRGELRSQPSFEAAEQTGFKPNPGEIWLESRLAKALNLLPNEYVDIGHIQLKFTRILTHEPDRAANFYSLTPRALIHLDDLDATQVVQPGSRVRYLLLIAGESSAIEDFRNALRPTLASNQRLRDAKDGNPQIGKALTRAQQYLNLASLIALLLCSVAVALSANRFAERHFDTSALLRCLGLTRGATLRLYALQLFMLGILACGLGAVLGYFGQAGLFYLLKGLMPAHLPSPSVLPAFAGVITGLIALFGFALGPLWSLAQIPPIRVLRRDTLPTGLTTWLSYLAAMVALALIMYRLSLDSWMTLGLVGGLGVLCLVLGLCIYLVLKSLRTLMAKAPLAYRLGMGQLLRYPLSATGQALAFGLIFLAMGLIALLRTELLSTWHAQLPERAPNYFALNIQAHEAPAFIQHIEQLSDEPPRLYPVVSGRLTHINSQPVKDAVTKEASGEGALRRDLTLTWSHELPKGNQILLGEWWQPQTSGVSVEAELAKRLQLKLGDELGFTVAGTLVTAPIKSIRSVKWDSFEPNFYMVFSPNTLNNVPFTYLTSFYIAPDKSDASLSLYRNFPSMTLMEVDSILKQVRGIIEQVTLAVEYVLAFILAAGLCVLFAALNATLTQRIRQAALLRALGASRPLINKARLFEFLLLGSLAGIIAMVGIELISFVLYSHVLELVWQPHFVLWLLPAISALCIGIAGFIGTRKALSSSPLTVLRQN